MELRGQFGETVLRNHEIAVEDHQRILDINLAHRARTAAFCRPNKDLGFLLNGEEQARSGLGVRMPLRSPLGMRQNLIAFWNEGEDGFFDMEIEVEDTQTSSRTYIASLYQPTREGAMPVDNGVFVRDDEGNKVKPPHVAEQFLLDALQEAVNVRKHGF